MDSKQYAEQMLNRCAEMIVEALKNMSIEDINMYQIGYEKGRADKYQEIISEYMLLTEEQVAEIKADAIEECIKTINALNIEYAYPHTICNILEQLKEQSATNEDC